VFEFFHGRSNAHFYTQLPTLIIHHGKHFGFGAISLKVPSLVAEENVAGEARCAGTDDDVARLDVPNVGSEKDAQFINRSHAWKSNEKIAQSGDGDTVHRV
jgi:hypothetical protein